MNKESLEHRERLKLLEKHIGEYYYMIGNIHSKISDAMEDYHQEQLKLLGIADVSQQRELFYNFITWYNAIPKMDKPKNGLITTDIIDKYVKL